MKALLLIAVPVALWAADVPAPVPQEVLAQAAQVEAATKAKVEAAAHPPSAKAIQVADDVDVLLLTSRVLLDQQEPTKAGNRFVAAVKALQDLSRADRKALGGRYLDQRQQLTELATRLLADPAVAAALDQPASEASAAPRAGEQPQVEQIEKPDPR